MMKWRSVDLVVRVKFECGMMEQAGEIGELESVLSSMVEVERDSTVASGREMLDGVGLDQAMEKGCDCVHESRGI